MPINNGIKQVTLTVNVITPLIQGCSKMEIPVCPLKAAEFDRLHSEAPKSGRKHAGAKELASQYTPGER